jgi:fatty acid desaturase
MLFERTSPGRLTVGVVQVVGHFLLRDLHAIRNRHVWSAWAVHLPAAALVAWWLFVVVDVPTWEYVFGFVLGGVACSALRSFVEHAAVLQGTRSAVIETNPVMALLFLNNNLHHTHHADPDLPWFDIPARHRELGSNEIAAEGAGYYRGYGQVLRRYLVTPFSQPDHPLSPGARPVGSSGIS